MSDEALTKLHRKERTKAIFYSSNRVCGLLEACDVHGGERGKNKEWIGIIDGDNLELPNIKAVEKYAKDNGYMVIFE